MDTVLKIVGALVILGALGMEMSQTVPAFGTVGMLMALQSALPGIGIGIALAAFGSMLGELKGIRLASERKADLYKSILDSRQPAK